jgi:hypothetical protein
MKQLYTQSLLEHPGHTDQSVHGRKRNKVASVILPPMSYDKRNVTIKRKNSKRTYKATDASFARVNRLLGKGRRTVYTDVVTRNRTYPMGKNMVGRWT